MKSLTRTHLSLLALGVVLIAAALIYGFTRPANDQQSITSFEECAAAGYPIMESYPRQCRTPEMVNFVEDISPVSSTTTSPTLPAPQASSTSPSTGVVRGDCVLSGCSSQLCVNPGKEMVTTCEFRAEYACYTSARCERQSSGVCGWTPTAQLRACLSNPLPTS